MTRARIATFVLALVCVYALALSVHAIAADTVRVRIPTCAEDEPYLRGRGDYSGGAWSRYVCVHIDDIRRV
jgi:hypothetical protein